MYNPNQIKKNGGFSKEINLYFLYITLKYHFVIVDDTQFMSNTYST